MQKQYLISTIACVLLMVSIPTNADNLASSLLKCNRLPKKVLKAHGIPTDQYGNPLDYEDSQNGYSSSYSYRLKKPLKILKNIYLVKIYAHRGEETGRTFYVFQEPYSTVVQAFKSSLNIDLKKRKILSRDKFESTPVITSRRLKVIDGQTTLQCFGGYAQGDQD